MATATIPAVGSASSKSGPAPLRRFRISDAMILVAATAVACGLLLAIEWITEGQISLRTFPELFTAKLASLSTKETIQLALSVSLLATSLALPFAAMWTLAIIPIRLSGPRPRFRRLSRQPGIIAALAAALALALAAIQVGLVIWLGASFYAIVALLAVPTYPGLAVLIAWMTLLLGRRWAQSRAGLIDWVGRSGFSGSSRDSALRAFHSPD